MTRYREWAINEAMHVPKVVRVVVVSVLDPKILSPFCKELMGGCEAVDKIGRTAFDPVAKAV